MHLSISSLFFSLVTAILIPIPAGAQQATDCVAVYDSTDIRVGRTSQNTGPTAGVLFEDQGRVARFAVRMGEPLIASSSLYFTEASCEGDAYMIWVGDVQPLAHRVGTDVWYPDTTVVPTSLPNVGSRREAITGNCINTSGPLEGVVPAFNFTLPTFTPPFHLEPEACFTLPPSVAALTTRSLLSMAVLLAFGAYVLRKRRFAAVEMD